MVELINCVQIILALALIGLSFINVILAGVTVWATKYGYDTMEDYGSLNFFGSG